MAKNIFIVLKKNIAESFFIRYCFLSLYHNSSEANYLNFLNLIFMKNLFEINETVSFYCGLNAPEITKVLTLKWGEASKMWLYQLECRKGVFFSEKSLSKVEQPKAKLKNEDVYSMQKIERIVEDEENQFYNRFINRFK